MTNTPDLSNVGAMHNNYRLDCKYAALFFVGKNENEQENIQNTIAYEKTTN